MNDPEGILKLLEPMGLVDASIYAQRIQNLSDGRLVDAVIPTLGGGLVSHAGLVVDVIATVQPLCEGHFDVARYDGNIMVPLRDIQTIRQRPLTDRELAHVARVSPEVVAAIQRILIQNRSASS